MIKNEYLVKKIYTNRSIKRINKKIKLLGNTNLTSTEFLNVRFLSTILIFASLLFLKSRSYVYAPVIALLYYFGLEYFVLDLKIKQRASKLDYEALFFFEVLSLSLETGKNLRGALQITVDNINNEMSREFQIALKEMDYGKTLSEALNNMKKRIPSDTINNVLLNISQSNRYGTSILDILNEQIDYLREKKLLEVKATISKMPIKISIISVLFFVPLILLLILGPVVINFFS